MTVPLAQQASACEIGVRILAGATAPSKREKEFLVDRIRAAGATLRWLEIHEAVLRAAIASHAR